MSENQASLAVIMVTEARLSSKVVVVSDASHKARSATGCRISKKLERNLIVG